MSLLQLAFCISSSASLYMYIYLNINQCGMMVSCAYTQVGTFQAMYVFFYSIYILMDPLEWHIYSKGSIFYFFPPFTCDRLPFYSTLSVLIHDLLPSLQFKLASLQE